MKTPSWDELQRSDALVQAGEFGPSTPTWSGRTSSQIYAEYFSDALSRQREREDSKGRRVIVGVTDLVFQETSQKSDGTLSADNQLTETVDFSTYPDRATIRLYNGRGYDVYVTRMQIIGNPIIKTSGENGQLLLDSMKHDDDIRRNGERVKTISNDYIFDATQVATISDYWYKRCGQKKHVYALQIPGSALWYEPGDWYTLAIGGAGQNEYISATVEVLSVSVNRSNGGIGSTQLIVRECMESWSKTTQYTARLVTGASPKRRTDQSNTVRVASSTFDGTYSWRCDGTDDDVQIQAAIDYLYNTFGGGRIELTTGTYNCSYAISLSSSIVIAGEGRNTIINSTALDYAFNSVGYSEITDIAIDSDGTGINFSGPLVVRNVSVSTASAGISYGIHGTGSPNSVFTGVIVSSFVNGYYAVNNIKNCIANSCTTGFNNCSGLQGNRAVSCGTKYTSCYADAGTTNPAADTAAGGYNS